MGGVALSFKGVFLTEFMSKAKILGQIVFQMQTSDLGARLVDHRR